MSTVTSKLAQVPEECSPVGMQQLGIAHVQVDAGDISGYDVVQLFNIGAFSFPILIVDIMAWVSEAFSASTTLGIGDGTSTSRFLDTSAIGPTAASWSSMKVDGNANSPGLVYTAAETIDMVVGGATPSAGTIDVYLIYARLGGI